MRHRGAAVLAAALALSAPGSALAQSTGDEQYRDPFAGEDGSQDGGSGGDRGGGTAGESTPAPAPPPAPAAVPPETSAAEPTAPTAGALPRTGTGAGWVTAAGLLLIAAGAGLRRSVRA